MAAERSRKPDSADEIKAMYRILTFTLKIFIIEVLAMTLQYLEIK